MGSTTELVEDLVANSQFPSSVAGVDVSKLDDDALYWWRTSGLDLARMMEEAGFPDKTKNQFLTFYSTVICPLLKGKPEPGSMPTAVGWDGNPFEYSWEFKGSTKKSSVRFVLDLSEVRPPNKDCPMSMDTVEEVLKVLKDKSPLYDDHWVRYPGTPPVKTWCSLVHDRKNIDRRLLRQVQRRSHVKLTLHLAPSD
jgi:DMATS type aromatic prenyltransferase